MKLFKDLKRRTKQQLFENIGLARGTEDCDFQAEYAEYKGTVNSIRHLQSTMRAHIQATKKQFQTAAALSVELAAFHRGTLAADGAMALGQAHAELERVQLASVERLFEEEAIAAADLLLWQVPEVEERVKQRRGLLLDMNSHQRKYETSLHALRENQTIGPNGGGGGILNRRRGESELSAEVATRKVRLEHTEAAFNEATEWCLTQFRALLDQRESGKVLGGPMAAFFAIQHKLMSSGEAKLGRIKNLLPLAANYENTLTTYDLEFARMQAVNGNDLFAGFVDNSGAGSGLQEELGMFGQPLSDKCPQVIVEAIEYLDTHGGLEVEGLFRVGGNQDMVSELRERYNAGEIGVIEQFDCDPHDVAALIKRFLLELPDSLIPKSFYSKVVAAVRENDGGEVLANVIGQLPENHLVCLSPLLQFLYRVARRSDINKMSFANLATCLAPSVIKAPQDESPIKIMNEMQSVIIAFKTLIENAKRFNLQNAVPQQPTQQMQRPPMHPNRQVVSRAFGSGRSFGTENTGTRNNIISKRMSMRKPSDFPSAITVHQGLSLS